MKKTILTLSLLAFATTGIFAQGKKLMPVQQKTTEQPTSAKTLTVRDQAVKAPAKPAAPTTTAEFKTETHDFGTLQEGDPAVVEFTFKNTGKEPLIVQNVHPSCGCTTPYWSKDPVAPGKSGVIKASYGTKGRPGSFNKSITVTSTAGTNVLHIKGVVVKAPQDSAPENTSMIKTK